MMLPPTYKQVCRVVKLLAGLNPKVKLLQDGFKTEGQREAAKVLTSEDQVILQMYRRGGKTYIVAVIAAIYIVCGERVILGLPTLMQASRILFKEIADIVEILFELLGGVRTERDSLTYLTWENGGSLLALTANTVSDHQEGYGGAYLLIDESHRIDPDILAKLLPTIDDAVEKGIGRVVILGVGGHKSKLIEWLKKKVGWKQYRYPASAEKDPGKQVIFDKARDTHSDIFYDQHYECLPCHEGLRLCYPIMNARIDTTGLEVQGIGKVYYFGIDIGKVDYTAVCVLERVGHIFNVVDHFTMTGQNHIPIAKEVYKFIDRYTWSPDRIIVEANSVGTYFQDTLNELGMTTRTIFSTETFKDGVWHTSNVAFKSGKLGVPDPIMSEKLSAITYSIKPNGHLDIEHCDFWSAFSMAWGGIG